MFIKKVLVVGGAGYIGGAVTDILLKRNIPFSVYDNLLYEHQYFKPVDFIYGDVRDREKLKEILINYSHIIWLAAIVGDGTCDVRPDLTVEVNQDAVEWISKNFKGRIIFMSTCSVYGQNGKEVIEESELNPLSLYAKTKMQAEKFLINKNNVIFRLGTVFGISDIYSRVRMDLAVNQMTARATISGKLDIFGGTQWRPFIHARNVAQAILNALESNTSGVYNIATLNYQIKDLGREIGELIGCKVGNSDTKFKDLRNYHINTQKAKKEGLLNFKKVLLIADGVKEISDLVKSKRIKDIEEDIYFNDRHITNLNNHGKL